MYTDAKKMVQKTCAADNVNKNNIWRAIFCFFAVTKNRTKDLVNGLNFTDPFWKWLKTIKPAFLLEGAELHKEGPTEDRVYLTVNFQLHGKLSSKEDPRTFWWRNLTDLASLFAPKSRKNTAIDQSHQSVKNIQW